MTTDEQEIWTKVNTEIARIAKMATLSPSAICKGCGCELSAHEVVATPRYDDQYAEVCWGDHGACDCSAFQP